MKLIKLFIIICVINTSGLQAFFDRDDEARLLRAATSISRDTLFTEKTENPLVENWSLYFKGVLNFDDLLVEVQNFPISSSGAHRDGDILELIFADFVLQLFSGNVKGWHIDPTLKASETQINKSVHALVCAGNYASKTPDIGNKIGLLTSKKNDPGLKDHFGLYEEAYMAGRKENLTAGTTTETVMREIYLGNIESLSMYFNYMRVVGLLRLSQGWWISTDVSFAWTHAPKFLTKSQLTDACLGLKDYRNSRGLANHPVNGVIGELLGMEKLDPGEKKALLEAYNSLLPFFDQNDPEIHLLIRGLRGSIFGQGLIEKFAKSLAQVLYSGKIVRASEFWNMINTFNEVNTEKHTEHLLSLVHHVKEFIVNLDKQLSMYQLLHLVRAFKRVDVPYHREMMTVMLIYERQLEGSLPITDSSFEESACGGCFYETVSDGIVKDPSGFRRKYDQLVRKAEERNIHLIEPAPFPRERVLTWDCPKLGFVTE